MPAKAMEPDQTSTRNSIPFNPTNLPRKKQHFNQQAYSNRAPSNRFCFCSAANLRSFPLGYLLALKHLLLGFGRQGRLQLSPEITRQHPKYSECMHNIEFQRKGPLTVTLMPRYSRVKWTWLSVLREPNE
ncbi:hypothetical protein QOT17_007154 [Balamuthia mandrillaris]